MCHHNYNVQEESFSNYLLKTLFIAEHLLIENHNHGHKVNVIVRCLSMINDMFQLTNWL